MRSLKSIVRLAILLAITTTFLTGCSVPKGETPEAQRLHIDRMADRTLAELYREHPALERRLREAPGYAVFSNVNTNIIFLSTGHGYGIVRDNRSSTKTYMTMAQIGVGLGIGLKDFKAVFLFKDRDTLTKFIDNGWEFGGHADATAKSGEKGGEASGAVSIDSDIEIYQFTEAGIALQATISGTKYWVDEDLN